MALVRQENPSALGTSSGQRVGTGTRAVPAFAEDVHKFAELRLAIHQHFLVCDGLRYRRCGCKVGGRFVAPARHYRCRRRPAIGAVDLDGVEPARVAGQVSGWLHAFGIERAWPARGGEERCDVEELFESHFVHTCRRQACPARATLNFCFSLHRHRRRVLPSHVCCVTAAMGRQADSSPQALIFHFCFAGPWHS